MWHKRPPLEIPDGELHTVDQELARGSHIVNWNEDAGKWEVLSPSSHAALDALLEAVHRAPKGGVTIKGTKFGGGMFILAADYAAASDQEKAAIDNPAKAAAEKRKGRDPSKLREKLKPHAHHDLTAQEKTAARRSLNALKRHHGELTAHRLDELAEELQAEFDRTPAEDPGRRQHLSRRLKAIEHQLGQFDPGAVDAPKKGEAWEGPGGVANAKRADEVEPWDEPTAGDGARSGDAANGLDAQVGKVR